MHWADHSGMVFEGIVWQGVREEGLENGADLWPRDNGHGGLTALGFQHSR
jgi:hypothetical protein